MEIYLNQTNIKNIDMEPSPAYPEAIEISLPTYDGSLQLTNRFGNINPPSYWDINPAFETPEYSIRYTPMPRQPIQARLPQILTPEQVVRTRRAEVQAFTRM
jgi:hypothetical protein